MMAIAAKDKLAKVFSLKISGDTATKFSQELQRLGGQRDRRHRGHAI